MGFVRDDVLTKLMAPGGGVPFLGASPRALFRQARGDGGDDGLLEGYLEAEIHRAESHYRGDGVRAVLYVKLLRDGTYLGYSVGRPLQAGR